MGISPRRLDGWEPRSRTVYRYDNDGRLAQSITTREPEWSTHDRELILALLELRGELCPSCGGWLEDCARGDTDPDQVLYHVPDPKVCQRCLVLGVKRDEYRSDPRVGALLFTARAKPKKH